MSRKMQSVQTLYPIQEQELLAIVLALKQWFYLLEEHKKFTYIATRKAFVMSKRVLDH